jgi:hypothetical protein
VTSSIGRFAQTSRESGGGDGGVCGYCMVDDTCLKGEGEGCQVSERGCGTTRSERGVSR